MKKIFILTLILSSLMTYAQTSRFEGNKKSNFGGAIGQGTLEVTDKGDSVCFTLIKGSATFDSLLVFYVDGVDGGLTTTANLAAGTDIYTVAVTGNHSVGKKSVLNFSNEFMPDFSVVFNKDGGRIFFFEKSTQGVDTLITGADVVINPMGSNNATSYSGTIAKADVSVSGPVSFKLLGTYIGEQATRSNEGFGDNFDALDNDPFASYSVVGYQNYSSLNTLPVKLIDFKATSNNGIVQLKWIVSNEVNIDAYEIQRSTDGRVFQTLGNVTASNVSTYSFSDNNPTKGNNYYRLITKEKGKSVVSKIIVIKVAETVKFTVTQIGNMLQVQLSNFAAGAYHLSLMNSNGQLVQKQTVQLNGTDANLQIGLNSNISKGVYRVLLQSEKVNINRSIIIR